MRGTSAPQIRHAGQDLGPVAADLPVAPKAPLGMDWRFVEVVVGEAGHHRLQVVSIDCLH